MRNELKKRVVVVAHALKKLAGPELKLADAKLDISEKIKVLLGDINSGNLTPDKLAARKEQIAKLQKILVQMNKPAA